MKFLITGGAGFIGSALVRFLINETEHSVVNFDKLTYAGNLDTLNSVSDSERYSFIQGDICDDALVRKTLAAEAPDKIMHLAAESHVDRSVDSPGEFIQTNIVGTFTLLNAALDYWEREKPAEFLFHHVSTDEVYGSLSMEAPSFTETTPYDPNSPYSASKASSDHLVRAWGETYGLPYVITNCSNNYGYFQFPEKLVPLMILNAMNEQPLPVYGDGMNVRDWLYVDDHARALYLVATSGKEGETYNIGGNSEKTNIDVVKTICSLLETYNPPKKDQRYEDLITYVTDRPGHDFRYSVDTSKIQSELGWEPEESFESGIAKTIEWYLENQSWCESVQEGQTERARLGLSRNKSG